jgi:hypothetical protein
MSNSETKIYAEKVDSYIWEQFKIFVIRKHGKLRGVLGPEISEALRQYLEKHKDTHAQEVESQSKLDKSKDVKNVKNIGNIKTAAMIAAKILDLGFKSIHEQQFARIVTATTGYHDKRTHDKYMNILIEHGVLKLVDMTSKEVFPTLKKKKWFKVLEVVRENAKKFIRIYGKEKEI